MQSAIVAFQWFDFYCTCRHKTFISYVLVCSKIPVPAVSKYQKIDGCVVVHLCEHL